MRTNCSTNPQLRAITVVCILITFWAPGALRNRYGFNEAPGSTAVIDAISGSNGVARVLSTTGGALPAFDGSQATLDGVGGYIDLPNGLVSGLTNITLEMWVTWQSGGMWTRLLDFGSNSNGEDPDGTAPSGAGATYLFLTATAGTAPRFAVIGPSSSGLENPILNSSVPLQKGVERYIAVTYGPAGARLYIDGQQVAAGNYGWPLSYVQDVNNWLGRSNWKDDPFFGGKFNEFRIHDSLLTPIEIFASKAAGPNAVNYTPENPISITLLVQSNMILGTTQFPAIQAQFPTYGVITLDAQDVTLTSSNTNIVRVGTNHVLLAVGIGTTTVTASLLGAAHSIVVTALPPSVHTELKHRYSFNESAGSTHFEDSIGDSDGLVYPPTTNTVAPVMISNGAANFPGGTYTTCGYLALPPYLISSEFTNVTMEFWVTWNGPANGNTWARVFDFGSSGKGSDPHVLGGGQTYLTFVVHRSDGGAGTEFRATADGVKYVSTYNNGPSLPGFPVGRAVHVVTTFAPGIGYSALYIDGRLQSTGNTPQVGDPATNFQFNARSWASPDAWDPNIWLGVSQWADPPLNGSLHEFRIWEGVLDEMDIALSRKAGPDALPLTNPGSLQSIALRPVPALLFRNNSFTQAELRGDYANVTGLDIGAFTGVQYRSTDTNVFVVDAAGVMTPVGAGVASLIATYNALESTAAVQVLAPIALYSAPVTTFAGSFGFNIPLSADFSETITNVNVTEFIGVTRTSSNTNLAIINNAGAITFIGNPGVAIITNTCGGLTSLSTVTVMPLPPRTLIHRYSFNEPVNSITVADSAGTADGNVVMLQTNSPFHGNFNGTGQFIMGPGPSQWPPTTNAFINLPNGLISSLSSVTVEAWFNWFGGSDNQRIWDFGMSSGATNALGKYLEDAVGGAGRSYFFLSPQTGRPRFAIKEGIGNETPSLQSPAAIQIVRSNLSHVAIVYDTPRGAVRLYVNGVRANIGAATLPLSVVDDRNNWIGRSQWQDPYYNGSIDEFRIYDGPASDADIAADFLAGPDAFPSPRLSARLSGNQLTLSWPVNAGTFMLQTSPRLGADAAWNSAGTPVVSGEDYRVTISVGAEPAFFRLQ